MGLTLGDSAFSVYTLLQPYLQCYNIANNNYVFIHAETDPNEIKKKKEQKKKREEVKRKRNRIK